MRTFEVFINDQLEGFFNTPDTITNKELCLTLDIFCNDRDIDVTRFYDNADVLSIKERVSKEQKTNYTEVL